MGLFQLPLPSEELGSWLWQGLSCLECTKPSSEFLLGMLQVIALCLSCRYFDDLLQLKGQLRKAGAEFLSWNDIQESVNSTNSSVQDENNRESCPQKVWACKGSPDIPGERLHWDSSP